MPTCVALLCPEPVTSWPDPNGPIGREGCCLHFLEGEARTPRSPWCRLAEWVKGWWAEAPPGGETTAS